MIRQINLNFRAMVHIGTLLVMLGTLIGCGANSVTIEGSYPTPTVTKLPLRVAVYYDQSLKDFTYTEYSETGREEYNIQSGQSHIELFNAVLPGMFDEVVQVNSLEEAQGLDVDAVFEPLIEEFQLALPQKTKLDVYEVWIKYNLRLTAPDGEYIADWVETSYGKTTQESFRSSEASINAAAVIALRDLASSFTLKFANVPEVRDWLASL
ncbi:MAG: hypothetical protein KJN90_10075 [Gammaproteobacteria bacterium]|nr:hypothetical protein [Gammaproteobacteria bacterium]